MHNISNINKSNKFLLLLIIKYISIIKFRKKFITIATIWLESIILSKVIQIFNSKIRIRKNLVSGLIF